MRFRLFSVMSCFVLVWVGSTVFVWAADPQVSNVRAQQLSDGTDRVEVLYDLTGDPTGGATVWVEFSATGSEPYDIIPQVQDLSGHIGAGISSGSNRRILWDAAATLPSGTYGTTYRAAVTASDPGGQTGDISIRLQWNGSHDLDIYVQEPSGEVISWQNPNSSTGGTLDLDANFPCDSSNQSGTENVFWPAGQAPNGTYTFWAELYDNCDGSSTVAYTLFVLEGATVVESHTGTLSTTQPEGQLFTYAFSGGSADCSGNIFTLLNGTTMELVPIPAGTFMMGSPLEERGHQDDEDLHEVTLTQGYDLGKFEVTQAQWEAVMGSPMPGWCDEFGTGPEYPVQCVSWNDVCGGPTGFDCDDESFIGRLNQYCGTSGFRLPTEAEWERAARAGTQTEFSFVAPPEWDQGCGSFPEAEPYMWWCGNNEPRESNQVGSKLPNAFGLFDMHGNVWEWVADYYREYYPGSQVDPTGPPEGYYRVLRGGSSADAATNCRSARRHYYYRHQGYRSFGFRLARSGGGPKRLATSHTDYSNLFTIDLRQDGPAANFSWSPTSPAVGQTVQFTDTSVGSPTSWSWNFGDGSTSTLEDPPHAFQSAATYSVTLTVSNVHGSDSRTRAITVEPGGPGNEVILAFLDGARSPMQIDLRPHDRAFLYYRLEYINGSPVTGGAIDYPVRIDGSPAPLQAYEWEVYEPGFARLTLKADQLNFSGNSDVLSFRTGSGVMQLGGSPVTVTAVPSPVTLSWEPKLFVDDWDLFAAFSAGATGTLGVRGSAGAAEATLAAAQISASGSAGMGVHLSLDSDEALSLSRRTELSLAASLKVPTVSGSIGPGKISATGLTVGAERGFTYQQAFKYRGANPNSEQAQMMHAAFFLEAASAGGVVTGFWTGTLIKALVATLNGLSGAGDLLEESLHAQTVGTSLAGSLSAGTVGFGTPEMGEGGPSFGFGISSASFSGALSSETSTLYGSGGAGTSPVGWKNSAKYALSADISPLNFSGIFFLAAFGVNGYSADITRSLYLDQNRQPSRLELSWRSQADQEFDIGIFRTGSFAGDDVTVEFFSPSLVQALVSDTSTGLRALKGDGVSTLLFGKAAFLGSVDEIKDIAHDWVGGDTAYTITTSATSGKVIGSEVGIGIPVVPPPTQVDIDLGLELEFQRFRSVAPSQRIAVTGEESYWPLLGNQTVPDWRDSDSVSTVLRDRVFSGLGPLVREAFLNLISFQWWPPWGKSMVSHLGSTEAIFEDVVRDREAGSVTLDDAYLDHVGSIVSGDPSRLEVAGPGGNKSVSWVFTTKRIIESSERGISRAELKNKTLNSEEVLNLVGQFVEISLEDTSGQPVHVLNPPGQVRFNLYQDQFDEMGGDWGRRNQSEVFRYDSNNGGWETVGGAVGGGGTRLTATIDRTGTYAPGLVTVIPANDSDGDGLSDDEEDINGNGRVDPGETDPFNWDSDGDGVSDGQEIAEGSDPLDSDSTPNRAPILAYIGNRSGDVGQVLEVQIHAVDPDADAVRFIASGLPSGATLNSTTGLLRWTPVVEGHWSVTITVEDLPPQGVSPLRDAETFLLIARAPYPTIGQAGENLYFIPAAAHASGVAGTSWVSDVALFNEGDSAATVRLYLLKSGGSNSNVRGRNSQIPQGRLVALRDIVLSLFGESSAAGSVLVGSDQPLLITSRTFNDASTGTFGQFVPGLALSEALSRGDQARLIQLIRNGGFRTNIGFANATDRALVVNVELHRSNGDQFASRSYSIDPYGYLQETDIIGTNISNAYAIVSSNSTGAEYFTYASVVDNRSGDPVLVLPPVDAVGPGGVAYVPGVAHVSGAAGTNWRTDLEVHNPGTLRSYFKLEFLKQGQANNSPPSQSFSLDSEKSVRFNDVVSEIFGLTGSGAIRVTSTAGSVIVSGRTYNEVSEGTFGQYIGGMTTNQEVGHGQSARLIQLSRSHNNTSGFRTNIGMVNTSGVTTQVRIELHGDNGQSLGVRTYSLSPFEFEQVNDISREFTGGSVNNGFAVVSTPTNGGRFLAYASVVDNRSGDPVYMPASVFGVESQSPPTAAPSLTATAVSSSRIDLSWTAVSGATGYKLYRASSLIYNGTNRSFSHTGLSANTQYCYTVQGYNSAGSGPSSAQRCATTGGGVPASAPTLTATAVSSSQIDLSWTEVSGAASYRLYRDGTLIHAGASRTKSDSGLDAATEYCYTVLARNINGDGPISQENCVSTHQLESWEVIELPPGIPKLYGITYGGGRFVAVGIEGVVVTSPDGRTWTRRSAPATNDLHDVCWNGSQFIAVGWNGEMIASSNGIAWTKRQPPSSESIYSVKWGNSRFVATVPRDGHVLVSYDGITWYERSIGIPDAGLNDVEWDGTRFVGVGYDNSPPDNAIVMESSNGNNWDLITRLDLGPRYEFDTFIDVDWTGSEYFASGLNGAIFTSQDALDWVNVLTAPELAIVDVEVHERGGVATADFNGGVYTSVDGAVWSRDSIPVTANFVTFGRAAVTDEIEIVVGGAGESTEEYEGLVLVRRLP